MILGENGLRWDGGESHACATHVTKKRVEGKGWIRGKRFGAHLGLGGSGLTLKERGLNGEGREKNADAETLIQRRHAPPGVGTGSSCDAGNTGEKERFLGETTARRREITTIRERLELLPLRRILLGPKKAPRPGPDMSHAARSSKTG